MRWWVWMRRRGMNEGGLQGEARRKTAPLPSILTPYRGAGQGPRFRKPTAANLRKFAEMPVARRAINLVKDRIASMDWQIRVRRGYDAADGRRRAGAHGCVAARA